MTDVCLKRKIRNYIETVKEDEAGYRIYIKDQVPLQCSDAEALEYLGVNGDLKAAKKDDPALDGKYVILCAGISMTFAPSAP